MDQSFLEWAFGQPYQSPAELARQQSQARAEQLRQQTQPGMPAPQMPPPQMPAPQMPPPQMPPPQAAPARPPAAPQGAPSALPRAMGQQQAPQPPVAAPDPLAATRASEMTRLMAERESLGAEQDKAYAPPDYSKMEQYAQDRQRQGGQHLMMALAANEAGKDFAPMQAQFLKQAAENQAPQKVTGGTLTEKGFVADPGYAQELNLKRVTARIAQNENKLAQNLTAQERAKTEEDNRQLKRDLQDQQLRSEGRIAAQASADRRHTADLHYGPGGGGKMSDKARSDLDAHDSMVQGLTGAVTALSAAQKTGKDSGTGWLSGLAQEKLPGGESLVAGHRTPEVNSAIQQMTFVTDAIRHERFGSALTVTEKASAAQYLPTAYDSLDRMIEKAKGLQNLIAMNNQRLVAKGQAAEQMPGRGASARRVSDRANAYATGP